MRCAHPTKYHEAAMKKISESRNKIWTMEEEQLVVMYELQNPSISKPTSFPKEQQSPSKAIGRRRGTDVY